MTDAAQQPEVPTLVNDLVARLRGKANGQNVGITTHLFDEAAARIESDAERIRTLSDKVEARGRTVNDLSLGATDLQRQLAASRERERALVAAYRAHMKTRIGSDEEIETGRVFDDLLRDAESRLATPDSAAPTQPTGEAE